MIYLAIFLIGFFTDRYVLMIFDLLTELFNHKLSTLAQSESIKNRRAELLFQREMEQEETSSHVIGFEYPEKNLYRDCDCEEDDCDCDCD